MKYFYIEMIIEIDFFFNKATFTLQVQANIHFLFLLFSNLCILYLLTFKFILEISSRIKSPLSYIYNLPNYTK